jgi:hypothetical protein
MHPASIQPFYHFCPAKKLKIAAQCPQFLLENLLLVATSATYSGLRALMPAWAQPLAGEGLQPRADLGLPSSGRHHVGEARAVMAAASSWR